MLHYRYRSERQDCELLPEYFTYYKTKHEKNLIWPLSPTIKQTNA